MGNHFCISAGSNTVDRTTGSSDVDEAPTVGQETRRLINDLNDTVASLTATKAQIPGLFGPRSQRPPPSAALTELRREADSFEKEFGEFKDSVHVLVPQLENQATDRRDPQTVDAMKNGAELIQTLVDLRNRYSLLQQPELSAVPSRIQRNVVDGR